MMGKKHRPHKTHKVVQCSYCNQPLNFDNITNGWRCSNNCDREDMAEMDEDFEDFCDRASELSE